MRTAVCDLLDITHPVVLGGMGGGTNPELVAAVSNAGALGIQACSGRPPDEIARLAATIRDLTGKPFGLNLLLFDMADAALAAVLDARPPIFSCAWARPEQDLRALFARAHEARARVMHMVSTVPEALRAVEAGADVIVAQGTEGGGHVGLMGSMVLVPLVVRAVAPVPVLAAGGVADGAGLAAALMLGAEGVLMGTRFLATPEAPLPESYKQVITASDGHNTLLTEIPDIASGRAWPGAYSRVTRNRLIEQWAGREGELRYRRAEVLARLQQAREAGDPDHGILYAGQTAGLIGSIEPAAAVVARLVADAETILRQRAEPLLGR
ncbi:MAG: nitronate monooxygenase [Chloroflexi bacterium]|nr:nitronate monooxygenase [Chloroflexota bacterium]